MDDPISEQSASPQRVKEHAHIAVGNGDTEARRGDAPPARNVEMVDHGEPRYSPEGPRAVPPIFASRSSQAMFPSDDVDSLPPRGVSQLHWESRPPFTHTEGDSLSFAPMRFNYMGSLDAPDRQGIGPTHDSQLGPARHSYTNDITHPPGEMRFMSGPRLPSGPSTSTQAHSSRQSRFQPDSQRPNGSGSQTNRRNVPTPSIRHVNDFGQMRRLDADEPRLGFTGNDVTVPPPRSADPTTSSLASSLMRDAVFPYNLLGGPEYRSAERESTAAERFTPLARSTSIGTAYRSGRLHDRLAQLDALRTHSGLPPAGEWRSAIGEGRSHHRLQQLNAAIPPRSRGDQPDYQYSAHTVRQTDAWNGMRPMSRRIVLDRDEDFDHGTRWNSQHTARTHNHQDVEEGEHDRRSGFLSSPVLWGEIPIDSDNNLHDALETPPFTLHVDGGAAQRLNRSHYLQRAFDLPERRPGQDGPEGPLIGRIAPRRLRPQIHGDDEYRDRLIHSRTGGLADPDSFVSGMSMLENLRIQPDMEPARLANIVVVVMRIISRMPSMARQQLQDAVLEHLAWSDFGERDGIERDEACCICHDEVSACTASGYMLIMQYEPSSKITITPCKHMYHEACLRVSDSPENVPNPRRGCTRRITLLVPCAAEIWLHWQSSQS